MATFKIYIDRAMLGAMMPCEQISRTQTISEIMDHKDPKSEWAKSK